MKKKASNVTHADFSELRNKAEHALNATGLNDMPFAEKDINTVFQELQVYQIELQLQNDELHLANEELELQRLKFTGLFNLAPVSYVVLNESGTIQEANPAAIELLGRKLSLINTHLQGFIAPDYREAFYNFYQHLLQSASMHSCQLKLSVKSGKQIYVLMSGIFIKTISQYYITITDISESINARQTIAEIKDRLELAMEASAAGTWALDLCSMKFSFDHFFYRLCESHAAKFDSTYQNFLGVIHPSDRVAADQHFRTAINTTKEVDVIFSMATQSDKPCYISMKGHLLDNADHDKSLIGIIWDITEKKQLEKEAAERSKAQQKEIAVAVMLAEEKERKRISESLHDSVSQLLYGIRLQLNELETPRKDTAMTKLNELLNMAVRETRNVSFELAPSVLTDFGLEAAVEELVKRLSTSQLQITLKTKGLHNRLAPNLEINIFRIIQELINNGIKHAEASKIEITLNQGKEIEVSVIDNGKGFDVAAQQKQPKGAGFSSIQSRVNLYAGHISISSAPGKGTAVTISLSC